MFKFKLLLSLTLTLAAHAGAILPLVNQHSGGTRAAHTAAHPQGSIPCGEPRFGTAVYPIYQSVVKMIPADFNGDGHLDLAGLTYTPGQVTFLNGDGKGGFAPTTTLQVEDRANDLAAIDFNNDGRADLAVISDFLRAVQVFINNGQGGFNQAPMRVLLPEPNFASAQPRSLEVGDFDGDRRADLLLSYDDAIVLIPNGGLGGYKAVFKPAGELSLSAQGVGDFTGDGIADLVSSPGAGPGTVLRIHPADGKGGFSPARSFTFTGQITSKAVIADFNGDGKLDVIVGTAPVSLPGGGTGSGIAILPGDGAGGLGAQTTIGINNLAANQVRNLIAADFNGDAKPDLMFGAIGKVYALLNNGSGGLEAPFVIETGPGAGGLVSGDFNGDSRADLVGGGGGPDSITTRINRCGAPGLFVSGRVTDANTLHGVNGVTLTLSGSQTNTTQTDIGGNYQFTNLMSGGNYTITAQRAGYLIDPGSRSVVNLAVDQPVNFNAIRSAANVSAASYSGAALAPESIATAFGEGLARSPMAAATLPLPTYLNDTRVDVRDSAGATRPAPLFFISPLQVNYLIPPETATGAATVKITLNSNTSEYSVSAQTVEIAEVAPGLFSANANGQGVAAAVVLRIKADGSQSYEPVAEFDAAQNRFVASPIDLGPSTDQLFLVLFGTGIRNRSALSTAVAQIGGENAEVLFAGPQDGFAGLDQVNLRLPRSLAGRGAADINLTLDGKAANSVRVSIR